MNNNCRICFEEDARSNLISPCLCSGNIKYVHRDCLDNWRNIPSSNDKNFYSCEICKEEFILEINDNFTDELNLKYKLYIGFEICSIVFILLTTIYLIGKIMHNMSTTKISLTNNQIINEFICGLVIILIICVFIGYVILIYSNRYRFYNNGANINNYLPNIKPFIVIIGIITLLIIIYYIIIHFINIRKKYFLNKEISNKYIVRDRDK